MPPAPCTCPAAPGCPCEAAAMHRYRAAVGAAAARFTDALLRARDDHALEAVVANEGAALDPDYQWFLVARDIRFCPVAHLLPCLAGYEAEHALITNPLVVADAPRRAAAILTHHLQATPVEAARAGRFLARVTPEGPRHPAALALLTRAYAADTTHARRIVLEAVDSRSPTDVLLALVAAAVSDPARLAVPEAVWRVNAAVWWAVYDAWSDPATVGTFATAALRWGAPEDLVAALLDRLAGDAVFAARHFPRLARDLAPSAVVPRLRAALATLNGGDGDAVPFHALTEYLAQAPLAVLTALTPEDLTPLLAADDTAFRAFALALLPAVGPTGRDLPERPIAPEAPLPF